MIWLVIFVISSIIFAACLGSSFHKVDYDEYAFAKNKYTTVDTSYVYTTGRQFLLLNYEFVYFSSTFDDITYSESNGNTIRLFTDTGYEVDTEVSLLLRLNEQNMKYVFEKYNMQYLNKIANIPSTTVKNQGNLSINDLLLNRDMIRNKFATAIRDDLYKASQLEVPLEKVTIGRMFLTPAVVSKNLEIVIQSQTVLISQIQSQISVINAETDTIVSQINGETNLTRNQAIYYGQYVIDNSVSMSRQLVSNARTIGINNIMQLLNISDKNAFLDIMSLWNREDLNTFLNMPSNVIVNLP